MMQCNMWQMHQKVRPGATLDERLEPQSTDHLSHIRESKTPGPLTSDGESKTEKWTDSISSLNLKVAQTL